MFFLLVRQNLPELKKIEIKLKIKLNLKLNLKMKLKLKLKSAF
jgi:hypothetical protein